MSYASWEGLDWTGYDFTGAYSQTTDMTAIGDAGLVQPADTNELLPPFGFEALFWSALSPRLNLEEYGTFGAWPIFGCLDPDSPRRLHRVCGEESSLSFAFTLPGKLAFTEQTTMRGCGDGAECVLVPEPGTYLLMLTGLLGLGFVAGRRREEVLA